jgi:hypothetical protein
MQTPVVLQQLLRLVLLLHLRRTVVYPIFLHLVVQVLIEFSEFPHAVGDAVPQVLIRLWLFVAFAVDFEEGLVVGADDVDAEAVAFGALGVVGSTAALIIAGDGDAHHVAADCTDVGALLAAVDEVHALHPLARQVVRALRPQYVAGHMHELPHALPLIPLLHDPHPQVGLPAHKLCIGRKVL